VDADFVTRLEQRLAALVMELQRQRERNARLESENTVLRGRVEQARRRLDTLLEAVAQEET
jgi:regulator of replication initiation timing